MTEYPIKSFMEVRMKSSKLYVGNLSYSVTKEQLEELFSNHGKVVKVDILEGKGFGFVEMSDSAEAEKARDALDNHNFEGRILKIDEARPPGPKSGRRRDSRDRRKGGYRRD
jgi:RNA recognition motif-containing protein